MHNAVDHGVIKDKVRANLNKYTRRAFASIPRLRDPYILDIGCGSGVPTIELATLCSCRIVALDNDGHQLSLLEKKVEDLKLRNRIEILNCSIHNLDFKDESFDVIWSEGSIFVVGFERGLREWRPFLKPNGYMAIHDEKGNVEKKCKQINDTGYALLDHFILDRDVWWKEYYAPLEKEIKKIQSECREYDNITEKFDRELQEIEQFKKGPGKFESVFFIIQRKG
jgi:ubiquinone/menaquinone biosynthesis C-methylase UbiE